MLSFRIGRVILSRRGSWIFLVTTQGNGFGVGVVERTLVIPLLRDWNPFFATLVGLPWAWGPKPCDLGIHVDVGLIGFEYPVKSSHSSPVTPV